MIRLGDYFHPNLRSIYSNKYFYNEEEYHNNDTETNVETEEPDYIYVERKDTWCLCMQYLLEKMFCCA